MDPNESGHYVESMYEDGEGGAVVNCRTLPSPPSPRSPLLLPMEEVAYEALVATVDIELLHRRLGHMRKTATSRLGKEELVRALEGGVVGELGVCRGCELGKALAEPHPPKDVLYKAAKELKLMYQIWLGL